MPRSSMLRHTLAPGTPPTVSPYREPAPHTCRFTEYGWRPGTTSVFRRCECGRRETFVALVGRALGRARCAVSSHRWARVRANERRHANLAHLHPLAGLDCVCERCGAMWNDGHPDWTSPAQ